MSAVPGVTSENTDAVGNVLGVGFQCEASGVEEANDRAWNVAFESFGSERQEERTVPASHRKKRWLVRAEVNPKFRIECDGAVLVANEIELDLISTRTG